MLAALGVIVGEEVELGTPLYGDKIVGPAIYQVSHHFLMNRYKYLSQVGSSVYCVYID